MPLKRYVVNGRVQGVGYRFFAARVASGNGLRGFVRNLTDGSVEVVAEGDTAGLENLGAQLAVGPELARVDRIRVEPYESDDQWDSFEIR